MELWFCEFGTVEDELAVGFAGVGLLLELGGLVVLAESFQPVVVVLSFIELYPDPHPDPLSLFAAFALCELPQAPELLG
jgi:hypothetical protein